VRLTANAEDASTVRVESESRTLAGTIAWWTILGLVAVVPILMANGPLAAIGLNFADGFDGVKIFALRIGVMVVLAAWIWDIATGRGTIRYHRIYILLGIFLGWIAITTILSISPETAFLGKYRRYDGMWSYLLYAALFFLTMQYAISAARIRQLLQTLSFSSVVVAGYGILQAVGADPLHWGTLPFEQNRSFSTFGNPDLLAGFLAFSIFINLGLLLSEQRFGWRSWYWFVLLLNSVVAITAFSRALWVAFLVAIIIFVLLAWRQRTKLHKQDSLFAAGIAAIVSAFIGYSLTRVDVVMNFWTRVQSIFEFDTGSALTRFQIWDAALLAIAQRPIFGYGLDTFRLIFRRFSPPEYSYAAGFRSVADNVHNFPLQLATGIGAVGATLFYMLLLWVAYRAIRNCLKLSVRGQPYRLLYIGITCACIAYCVHIFFGLALPSVAFLLWICMGMLLAPDAKTITLRPILQANLLAKSAAVVATMLLLAPCIFATRLLIADHVFVTPSRFVATQLHQADVDSLRAAQVQAQAAVVLNPFYERYYTDYFMISSRLALLGIATDQPDAHELVAHAKQQADHLIAMSPWEYDSYLVVANFYIMLGQTIGGQEGRDYVQYAADFASDKIQLAPNGLALRVRYAEAHVLLGEIDAARYQLEFVTQQDSNYRSAAEFLQELIDNPDQFPPL